MCYNKPEHKLLTNTKLLPSLPPEVSVSGFGWYFVGVAMFVPYKCLWLIFLWHFQTRAARWCGG